MLRFFRSPAPCLAHVPSHPSLAHVPSHLSLAHVPSHPSLAHVPSRSRWAQVFSTMQQFRSSVSRLEVTAAPRASATHDPRERERERLTLSLSLSLPPSPRRERALRAQTAGASGFRLRASRRRCFRSACALLAAAPPLGQVRWFRRVGSLLADFFGAYSGCPRSLATLCVRA